MKLIRRRPLIAVAVVAVGAVAVAGTAIAFPTPNQGGTITGVKVVRETQQSMTTSSTFIDVPGASTTITVPAGQRALILARFSAESSCAGPAAAECRLRILIGGVEGAPGPATDFVFDASSPAESHSMDRSRGVGAGTHTVQVQQAVSGQAFFSLDDWHLTVERAVGFG